MKRKRRYLKRNKAKTGDFIKNNQKTVFLVFIFIIGVFSGAYAVKNSDAQLLIAIKELAENYLELKNNNSIMLNFIYAIVTDLIFLIVSSIFGLCLIGSPMLWALPAIRGMGIGVILGYIYTNYSVNGLIYGILVICLPSALSACALIISCKEGLLTLNELHKSLSEHTEINAKQFYKLYFLRNIILLTIMAFSAAIGSFVLLMPSVNLAF